MHLQLRPLWCALALIAIWCLSGCAANRDQARTGADLLDSGGAARESQTPKPGEPSGPAASGPSREELPRHIADALDRLAPHATPGAQFVYVDPEPASPTRAQLYAVQRSASGWQLALAPVPANLGRNGVAPPWEKREGDGRTPSGSFPLRQAFGYPPGLATRLPYRQLDSGDLWVDDPQALDYNRWARRGETAAGSYEELLRRDPLYRYALVVEYNTAPVVRDLGSAIFLHLERAGGGATSGCVSLSESDLLRLLLWLDPSRHPQLVIGTQEDILALADGVRSRLPADLPAELRLRLLDSDGVLALRRDTPEGYFAVAVPLPAALKARMLAQKTWRPGCPVPPRELAYLVTAFWGFDGKPHYGELVVHAALAAFVIDSLQSAYRARFPIERMKLIEAFDGDDEASMAANNSSAFNCRFVPGKPGTFSRHSFGAALDLNPLQNPYVRFAPAPSPRSAASVPGTTPDFSALTDGPGATAGKGGLGALPAGWTVEPPASVPFLQRRDQRPGMLQAGDPLLSAFARRGWVWGGTWRSPDYQHIDFPLRKLVAP
jgi:L,D-peptidoglycan transpeptidase YkuD (ErfK/YbiS/YcfS/YnhG family)